MNVRNVKSVHLIGVGGINMSAVAKLLLRNGVAVSGSDLAENEQTRILREKGAAVSIGESPSHIPDGCELVIVTSAAPKTNRERLAADARHIPEMTNFAFLGQWFADAKTIVVAGTHGKSTTTAMLGLALERAGMDPTVVVGSKVPGFPEGNLRIGRDDLFVIEGDEYARHFLEFEPYGLILTNIELDHVDVFASINEVLAAFHELTENIRQDGVLIANSGDGRIHRLLGTEQVSLSRRRIRTVYFSKDRLGAADFDLSVPGAFNRLNALAAYEMATALGADEEVVRGALSDFPGIWRRFEFLTEKDGYRVYSDYGHHPTEVSETLAAARGLFPDSRIILCFQPHHRNRTKALFNEFVRSFDEADALVIADIYAVSGRDDDADMDISSEDLIAAVRVRDRERGKTRDVVSGDVADNAVAMALERAKPGDVVIVMGAGDVDDKLRKILAGKLQT